MPLTCNIDANGKRVRLFMGIILSIAGLTVGLVWSNWIIAGILLGGGAFTLFEARAGWCAVRAMGFKTKV